MRKLLIALIPLIITINAGAQVKKRIKKARRYKSESQFTLSKSDFQVEWEIGRETIDSTLTTLVYPNLVLHYALSDRLEVNTEMSLIRAKNSTGIEPVLLGVNYQILRDSYNGPSVVIAAQLAIPFLSTKDYAINYPAPVIQVNLQQAIHENWTAGFSTGLLWDGYIAAPSFSYNINTSYTCKKRWLVSAECFGFVNHDLPQNNIDASFAYIVNDLVQLGVTAGVGISSAAPKNYVAINGTWGLHTSRKVQRH